MDDSSATAQLFLISSPTGWMIENNGMKVKLKLFQHISWKSISHCLLVNWYCFSHCLHLKQFLIFGLLLSFFKMDGFQARVQKYKSFHFMSQWYSRFIAFSGVHGYTVPLTPWSWPVYGTLISDRTRKEVYRKVAGMLRKELVIFWQTQVGWSERALNNVGQVEY